MVLFVSGFGSALTDETFAQLFSSYGRVVSCKVLIDIPTGKSKGCGLIRMENKRAADAAIAGLNGTTLQGQVTSLTVKVREFCRLCSELIIFCLFVCCTRTHLCLHSSPTLLKRRTGGVSASS